MTLSKIALARCLAVLALALALPIVSHAQVNIVAAENFYGDIAKQIGGAHVDVMSILHNPEQDPHLFEASPSTARALAKASIVIYNGVDYDPWMRPLLKASPSARRVEIVAGDLLGRHAGANPHLWYDPATIPRVARALTSALRKADPAHGTDYKASLERLDASLGPIVAKIESIRKMHAGISVTATEPVFGYMAAALGFKMRNERLQLAIMNDTEPSARDVAAFENDLRTHKVRILFFNRQAGSAAAKYLLGIATAAHVPVVGVTETEPAGVSYQSWMLGQLNAVEKALQP
ncbi:MAG: cation ABC transporter substrate-binding protein [Burkholderiaceae bacterium]|nr:MAG: cation ABC transporter substrate-binding protein [Burkholderiaceae bacterium]